MNIYQKKTAKKHLTYIITMLINYLITNRYELKIKENALKKIPLTYKKLPLTDFLKKYLLFLILIYIFYYFCKNYNTIIFMFKAKSLILFFLLFLSTSFLFNRSLGCVQNNVFINKLSISIPFINNNLLSINKINAKPTSFNRENNVNNDTYFLSEISPDDSESKPFINLDFSLSNCIPESQVNDQKYKLGLDDGSFYLFTKHASALLSLISNNKQQEEKLLYFVVPSDNIILFRQIQI